MGKDDGNLKGNSLLKRVGGGRWPDVTHRKTVPTKEVMYPTTPRELIHAMTYLYVDDDNLTFSSDNGRREFKFVWIRGARTCIS